MEFFLVWLVCGFAAAVIAGAKGRNVFGWLILGLAFGIFALLAVGFMPSLTAQPVTSQQTPSVPQTVTSSSDLRPCPHCAEDIKRAAKVCRFCQRDVEPMPSPQPDKRIMRGPDGRILGIWNEETQTFLNDQGKPVRWEDFSN